jgi:hypothetical protein
MDPYQLAQIYSLLTARKGDNVGLTVSTIAGQQQQAQMRAQQMREHQMQMEQQQRQYAQEQQRVANAQRAFAPGVQPATPNDDNGNPMPTGGGGGMQEYAQSLLGQGDIPQYLALQQSMAKESPFTKIDPKDYTPESLSRFAASKNPADLRTRDKVISEDLGGKRSYRTEYSTEPLGAAEKTASPDALLTDSRTRAEGAANRGVSIRGQDMTDERARELAAQGKAPNEQELVAAGYSGRMQAAEKVIQEVGKTGGPSNMTFLAANTPKVGPQTKRALERFVMSPEQQQYRQAQEDWVRAKLRKESGAVIAEDEMQREIETYFPQLGDSEPVKRQKTRARATAVEAMNTASGKARGMAAQTANARPPLESFNQ